MICGQLLRQRVLLLKVILFKRSRQFIISQQNYQSQKMNPNYSFHTPQRHSNEFNAPRGPELNVNIQPPTGNFNIQATNQPSQGQSYNNTNMQGPSFNQGPNTMQPSERIPFSSEQIKAYIRKYPYTQTIQGQDITYSVLPKKQQTFVMTHDRFLLLKGTEVIGYARQFPAQAELPFRSLEQVPAPKVATPISEIEKVNVEDVRLFIHFSGTAKTVWQFQCPTRKCAMKWAQTIEDRMMQVGHSFNKRYGEMDSPTRRENVNQINSFLNTSSDLQNPNTNISINASMGGSQPNNFNREANMGGTQSNNFNREANINLGQTTFNPNYNPSYDAGHRSDLNRSLFDNKRDPILIENGPPHHPETNLHFSTNNNTNSSNLRIDNSYSNESFGVNANFNNNGNTMAFSNANTLGSNINRHANDKHYFEGAQMSKVEDFIASRRLQRSGYEPKLLRSNSVSKLNTMEKENIRRDLSKMRRNWIEELLGGQEEVELLIDFKMYVQALASVIVTELYVGQNEKIFPAQQINHEYASFVLDDVYLEIYFFHQGIEDKHPRFMQAALEFKNLDYLLSVTRNEGSLKVPFMMLFEYKGFLGMARTRLPENSPIRNRQCYNQLNIKDFEETSRISADTLLNEQACKIVSYYRRTPISTTSFNNGNVYFVERLLQLLPLQKDVNDPTHVLRPELLQENAFDNTVFRNKYKAVRMDAVGQLIDQKINQLIKFVENEEEYFTNSRQLQEMIHLTGLNMRHLGIMYQRTRLNWFRRIIQAEIVARALKNLFRRDIQNCVMIQTERNKNRQRQEDYEKRRVISFLNVVFGNTKDTQEVWKRINRVCQGRFGIAVSEADITGANIPYLMQALQTHLKIVLNESIHRKRHFQSPQTFDPSDFKRFEFDTNIYSLDFTDLFQEIEQCLDFNTPDSFYNLSSILIKETSNRVPVIDMLKKHPIHERISQFLLNFTSPEESKELYTRMEVDAKPSKFLYESKLAEIKWYLKSNRHDMLQHPASFVYEHGRKWLGEIHPLFTQVSRLIASYFSDNSQQFQLALKYAQDALEMQKKIFGGDNQALWKDYFLLGKIYFINKNIEQGMKYLYKSRQMVRIQDVSDFETFSELNILLCKGHFGARRYKEAFNTAKELYTMLRSHREEKSLSFLLESVGWMRQILEVTQDHQQFFHFLETDFSNLIKVFAQYPAQLILAIRTVALPTIKNAITKSRNGMRVMSMMEELSRLTQNSQSTLSNYLRDKIIAGTYPRSFLLQLKDLDNIVEEVYQTNNLERWKSFYQNSSQSVLDTMATVQVNRNFEFLANLTALFNLFGRQVMDELQRK